MSIQKYKLKNGYGYKARVETGGKPITRRFRRKVDAEVWEREQKQLYSRGGRLLAEYANMSVEALTAYWLQHYASARKTRSSQHSDQQIIAHQIVPHLGGIPVRDLDQREVELWVNKISTNLKPKTVNNCLGLLKKMLGDAVRWRLVQHNAAREVERLRVDEAELLFWDRAEVEKVLTWLQAYEPNVHAVVAVAVNTGMRKGELRSLMWDCVHLDTKLIDVRRGYCEHAKTVTTRTKSGRHRHVPINPALLALLQNLKATRSSLYVLPYIDFNHAHRVMDRVAEAAGVKRIRFHDLRHTFASNFMMAGGSIYELQKILGHSTLKMTERYLHLSPGFLAGATDRLNFGAGPSTAVTVSTST